MNGRHGVAEHLKARGGTISECKLAQLMIDAVNTGDARALKRLIRWTGHVNVSDFDGQTPLHTAAMCGRLNIANLLLKEGAGNYMYVVENNVLVSSRRDEISLQVLRQLSAIEPFNPKYQRTNSPVLFPYFSY